MHFKELKLGLKVEDTWYNSDHVSDNWGKGKIVKVLKTRFKVAFSNKNANHTENGIVTYDKSHAQFIRKIGAKK